VRGEALRHLRRPQVEGKRLMNKTAALQMSCELPADGIEVVLVERLDRPRHALVDLAPPCRSQAGIGDLANLVVAEVVGISPMLVHDPAPPQLVEAAHERIVIVVACARQDVEVKRPPDHRRDAGHLAREGRELRQARFDHHSHPGWEFSVERWLQLEPLNVWRETLESRAGHLHNEERVALGLGVQLRRRLQGECAPTHLRGQRGCLAGA
jgi:hypothetical protein